MRLRRPIGAGVLVLWLIVLGWHVKRVVFPGELQRLAEAALTLPPGVAYYALFSGRERAGWAQIELDTLPGGAGFHTLQRLIIELPGLGPAGVSEVRTEIWQGADLALDSFLVLHSSGGDTARITAHVLGDSVIAQVEGDRRSLVIIPASQPAFLSATWPLRLAADGRAKVGDRYGLFLYDPLAGQGREVEVRIVERESRVWADSADLDSLSGRWVPVHHDSVRAWRVTQSTVLEHEFWIDEDGRYVRADLAGGLRMERTAFEIAFFNRLAGRRSPVSPP